MDSRAVRDHASVHESWRGVASRNPQGALFAANAKKPEAPSHPALEALRGADPDALSPKDALDLLYKLKRLSE